MVVWQVTCHFSTTSVLLPADNGFQIWHKGNEAPKLTLIGLKPVRSISPVARSCGRLGGSCLTVQGCQTASGRCKTALQTFREGSTLAGRHKQSLSISYCTGLYTRNLGRPKGKTRTPRSQERSVGQRVRHCFCIPRISY